MDVWQGSELPPVLNISGFWIIQDSEYVSGSECARVLDIPEFWICQGYTGLRICLINSWISLNMSNYVWTYLNMLEYAWICLNLPEWLLFNISPFLHLLCNPFSTWTHGYLFEDLEVINWRNTRLFSWRDKIWFFFEAPGDILFVFCSRLNIAVTFRD